MELEENIYAGCFEQLSILKHAICLKCKETKVASWYTDLYYKRVVKKAPNNICDSCLPNQREYYRQLEEKGVDVLGSIKNKKKTYKEGYEPIKKVFKEIINKAKDLNVDPNNPKIEIEISKEVEDKLKEYPQSPEPSDEEIFSWKEDAQSTIEDLRKQVNILKEKATKIDWKTNQKLNNEVWDKIMELEERIIQKQQVPQIEPTKCSYCEGKLHYVVKEAREREPLVGLCEAHQRDNDFCKQWVCTDTRSYYFCTVDINGKWQLD